MALTDLSPIETVLSRRLFRIIEGYS